MDKTLLKGLDVLQALAMSDGPRGVSELGRELGLTRSNAHRTLRTLCEAGFVRQNEASACSTSSPFSSVLSMSFDVPKCETVFRG